MYVTVTVSYKTEIDPSDFIDIETDEDGEEIDPPSDADVIAAFEVALQDGDVDLSDEISLNDATIKVTKA